MKKRSLLVIGALMLLLNLSSCYVETEGGHRHHHWGHRHHHHDAEVIVR